MLEEYFFAICLFLIVLPIPHVEHHLVLAAQELGHHGEHVALHLLGLHARLADLGVAVFSLTVAVFSVIVAVFSIRVWGSGLPHLGYIQGMD